MKSLHKRIVIVNERVCSADPAKKHAPITLPTSQKDPQVSSGEGVEDMSSGWFVPKTPFARGRPHSVYICEALP